MTEVLTAHTHRRLLLQISIFVGSLHSEDSWFHSKFFGKSLDTMCWHKGSQCCHHCYWCSQSTWRHCWGLWSCWSSSTWGTGTRRRRREMSCHHPKLTLWKSGGEMAVPEAWNLTIQYREEDTFLKNKQEESCCCRLTFFPPNKHLPRVVSWLVDFCNPLEGDAVAWHDQTPNTAERP